MKIKRRFRLALERTETLHLRRRTRVVRWQSASASADSSRQETTGECDALKIESGDKTDEKKE